MGRELVRMCESRMRPKRSLDVRIITCNTARQTFSPKGQIVYILGFASHSASTKKTQLWNSRMKATQAACKLMGLAVCQPTFIYKNREYARFGQQAIVYKISMFSIFKELKHEQGMKCYHKYASRSLPSGRKMYSWNFNELTSRKTEKHN